MAKPKENICNTCKAPFLIKAARGRTPAETKPIYKKTASGKLFCSETCWKIYMPIDIVKV